MKFPTSKILFLALIFSLVGSTLAQDNVDKTNPEWSSVFQRRLSSFGHRNWIVVADSAFPEYSQPGIETITVDAELPSVLSYVVKQISASKHVRPYAFVDKELQFVDESDYPGVSSLRKETLASFGRTGPRTILHSDALSMLADASKTYRVLIIKTKTTIPYTTVFIQLDCRYITDQIEQK